MEEVQVEFTLRELLHCLIEELEIFETREVLDQRPELREHYVL